MSETFSTISNIYSINQPDDADQSHCLMRLSQIYRGENDLKKHRVSHKVWHYKEPSLFKNHVHLRFAALHQNHNNFHISKKKKSIGMINKF